MLDHLGEGRWGEVVLDSIEDVLLAGQVRTQDIGGSDSTDAMGSAICEAIRRRAGR